MSWVIPSWLALVEFLGLTAKEYDEHDDDKATMSTMTATTATATASTPDERDGGDDGNNDKGDVDGDGGGDSNYDNDDVNDNNDDDDNDDNGTTAMRWRQRRWNNDDVMAMGSRALCHPSEATVNLCQQFGEESTRERDDFGHMLECTLKTSATSFHYLNIDEE